MALTEKLWATKVTDEATNKNDVLWGGQGEAQKIAYANQQQGQIAAPQGGGQPLQAPPQPFGGGQQQADPFGGGTSAASAPTQTMNSGFGAAPQEANQFGAQPQEQAAPTRKPRGPNKPKAEPPVDDGIPPFLRRTAEPAPPVEHAPNPTQFGMQAAPPAPDAGIQAALDAAFRLPT